MDLEGITAMVILEPVGGGKRTLETEVVAPEGSEMKGLGQGGEVREMGEFLVEFVVVKPHAGHGDDGHGDKERWPKRVLSVPSSGVISKELEVRAVCRSVAPPSNQRGFVESLCTVSPGADHRFPAKSRWTATRSQAWWCA